jgi:hypothetical protein
MPTVKPDEILAARDWAVLLRKDHEERIRERPKDEFGYMPIEAHALAFKDALDDALDCCHENGRLIYAMLASKLLVNPFTPAQREALITRAHYCSMAIANGEGRGVDDVEAELQRPAKVKP